MPSTAIRLAACSPICRSRTYINTKFKGIFCGKVVNKRLTFNHLAGADDDTLLEAMAAHPILINRPVVITARGTRLCRPPEAVLELLG